MINEVTITAKFVTGTTVQDSEQAKAAMQKVLLEMLARETIYPNDKNGSHGVFSVEILKVKAEKI